MGIGVSGFGFRVSGFGFRVWGIGWFGVQTLELRDSGLGFSQALGLRLQG